MHSIPPLLLALITMINLAKPVHSYNYFAIGSNMASSTMTNLRKLNPIASTPAILKDHRLAFNVPGTPFIEPSWASVEMEEGSIIHGVLYKLTEDDFAKVCQTEGVPFSYKLHRCEVMPYEGDGVDAGARMWLNKDAHADAETQVLQAFTLRAGKSSWRKAKNIPPSKSYKNVLLRGAREFKIDEDYVRQLEQIKCSEMILGDGIAEKILQFAELQK